MVETTKIVDVRDVKDVLSLDCSNGLCSLET
jgi:hypothetical protein